VKEFYFFTVGALLTFVVMHFNVE